MPANTFCSRGGVPCSFGVKPGLQHDMGHRSEENRGWSTSHLRKDDWASGQSQSHRSLKLCCRHVFGFAQAMKFQFEVLCLFRLLCLVLDLVLRHLPHWPRHIQRCFLFVGRDSNDNWIWLRGCKRLGLRCQMASALHSQRARTPPRSSYNVGPKSLQTFIVTV